MTGESDAIFSRYTVKISFTVQDNTYEAYIIKLKAILHTFQLTGDRKCFLALQFREDFEIYKNIGHSTQISIEFSVLSIYISRLFIKKGTGARTEYLQLYIGHYEAFSSIKRY